MLFTGLCWSVLRETVPSVWVPPEAVGRGRYSRSRAQFLPIRTSQPVNNIHISSHVKISPLLWLHNKPHLSDQKTTLSRMVWHFIGVYIINRRLRGRLEIRNFSSGVEKNISLVRCGHSWIIFQHSKRNFVYPRGHVISSFISLSEILAEMLL